MKTEFRKSFTKDLEQFRRNTELLNSIKEIIVEVEEAAGITAIKNLKKLREQGTYYRIRFGSYRIGLVIEDQTVTFVRALHRREIYRYFP